METNADPDTLTATRDSIAKARRFSEGLATHTNANTRGSANQRTRTRTTMTRSSYNEPLSWASKEALVGMATMANQPVTGDLNARTTHKTERALKEPANRARALRRALPADIEET